MAFELITGHAGRNHVDSADMGEAFAGIVGKGRYILDTGQGMACTMADSNTLRVGTGSMLMDGRIVRNETAATFKIANGAQGRYRHDLACLKYTLDRSNDSIESVTPIVLQGTAASSESAAKDPSYTAGDILSGDLTAIVPIARVKLAGLTPTCEKLLSSVTSLKSLGESVSRVLVRPGIKLNGTVAVIGLKNRAAVTVSFGHGQHAIMPTADGTHIVTGAAGGDGWSVVTASATATVSGERVTFKDTTYNMYTASALGSALTFVAGDAETIDAIYG